MIVYKFRIKMIVGKMRRYMLFGKVFPLSKFGHYRRVRINLFAN